MRNVSAGVTGKTSEDSERVAHLKDCQCILEALTVFRECRLLLVFSEQALHPGSATELAHSVHDLLQTPEARQSVPLSIGTPKSKAECQLTIRIPLG